MKIILSGPPRSGKSCLREGLKQVMRQLPGAPYPYIITACPDGEGSWFQETVNSNPELAAECKKGYKSKFTPEFVDRITESVRNCPLELVFIDVGGIPSAENEQICSGATHLVLLTASDKADKKAEWYEFSRRVGLVVIADIDSAYSDRKDVVGSVIDGKLTGSVHHLERGEVLTERPMIMALARHILSLL
jgi:CRISPR-associated protein Csx3